MAKLSNKEKKAKKRKQKLAKQKAQQQNKPQSTASVLKAAGRLELLECRISENWAGTMLAQVLITRKHSELTFSWVLFLVDLAAMGVKNTIIEVRKSSIEYSDFVRSVGQIEPFVECEPAFAVKLIQEAVRFADKLGIAPDPDYAAGKYIFGDIDPSLCKDEIPLGRGGQPFYVQGPNDDPVRVAQKIHEYTSKEMMAQTMVEFAAPLFAEHGEDTPLEDLRTGFELAEAVWNATYEDGRAQGHARVEALKKRLMDNGAGDDILKTLDALVQRRVEEFGDEQWPIQVEVDDDGRLVVKARP